jgi:hypothetical protein
MGVNIYNTDCKPSEVLLNEENVLMNQKFYI